MNFSVSRIHRAWSCSFTYAVRNGNQNSEMVVCASHVGQALRIFIQSVEGVRCLNLNGYFLSDLASIKSLDPVDIARSAISTCTTPEVDIDHYFVTVLSNSVALGRCTPVSSELVMEIMEVIGTYRESSDHEGLHNYLTSNDLLDLEDSAHRFHPCIREFEFWKRHWVSICARIIEDAKRGNHRGKS